MENSRVVFKQRGNFYILYYYKRRALQTFDILTRSQNLFRRKKIFRKHFTFYLHASAPIFIYKIGIFRLVSTCAGIFRLPRYYYSLLFFNMSENFKRCCFSTFCLLQQSSAFFFYLANTFIVLI